MRLTQATIAKVLGLTVCLAILAGCAAPKERMEGDVVVVGGGGAGLAAAIEAASAGASVILLEKTAYLGGNTRLSGGLVPGVGTKWQKAGGIEDSPERYAEDIMKANGGTGDPALVRVATEKAKDMIPWFESLGAEFLKVVQFPGHSVPRLHQEKSLSGAGLVSVLEKAAKAKNVKILLETPAKSILRDDKGNIVGVLAQTKDGRDIQVKAKAVVLAAGGFAANKEMVAQYIPAMRDAGVLGHPGSTGDGIRMGIEVGADTRNMDAYCPHATVNPDQGTLITWEVITRGGILVNKDGKRFINETLGYAKCAPEVSKQKDGLAYVIYDDTIRAQVEKTAAYEHIVKAANSVQELAQAIGVDKEALEATIKDYNEAVAAGKDQFGRTTFGKPLSGKLYAILVKPYVLFTQGGLRIDIEARVLNKEGKPIPGLFAAGENADTGLCGTGYAGYITGNGLLGALAFGRIAGENAAKFAQGK